MKLFLVFALFSLLLHAEAKRSFYDDAEDSGSVEDIQAYKASPRLASAAASSGAKAVPNIPTRASPAKVIPLADSDEEQTSESEEVETSASASSEEGDDDENQLDEDEDGEDSEEEDSEEVTPSTTTTTTSTTTTTTTTPKPIEATPAAKKSSRRHRKKAKKTDEAKQADEVPSIVEGKIPEVREQFVQLAQEDDTSQAREGFIQRYGRPPVKLISQASKTSKEPRKPKVTLSPIAVIPPSKSTSEEEEEEEEKTPVKTSGKRRQHRNRHQKQQKETSKLPSALADRVRDESSEEVVFLKPIKIDFPRDDLPRETAQKVEEVEEAPRQKKKKRTRHQN